MWKMRHTHCRTWNMARKLKKVEKKTQRVYYLNMARNTEKGGKSETNTVGLGLWGQNR